MKEKIYLSVAKDYSKTPGTRYIKEGKFSGEDFLEKLLYPKMKEAIDQDKILVVNLDGTAGYATSFLDESFGGLIYRKGMDYHEVISHLEIEAEEFRRYKENVYKYLEEAKEIRRATN